MSEERRREFADRFVRLASERGALLFGDYTLKSGRKTPYFLNTALMTDTVATAFLGEMVAELARGAAAGGTLLGLPYKGIALAALGCAALGGAKDEGIGDYSYAYLRKEAKTHGEGGMIVGSAEREPVLLVDDVLTTGTAVMDALPLMDELKIKSKDLLLVFDRYEKATDTDGRSSAQMLEEDHGIKVHCLVTARDFLRLGDERQQEMIKKHLEEYAPAD